MTAAARERETASTSGKALAGSRRTRVRFPALPPETERETNMNATANLNPPAAGEEAIRRMVPTLERLGYTHWSADGQPMVPAGLPEAIAAGWETGSPSPDGRWLKDWITDRDDGFSTTKEILDFGIHLDHMLAAAAAGDIRIDPQGYGNEDDLRQGKGIRFVWPTGHGRCADRPCQTCLEADNL